MLLANLLKIESVDMNLLQQLRHYQETAAPVRGSNPIFVKFPGLLEAITQYGFQLASNATGKVQWINARFVLEVEQSKDRNIWLTLRHKDKRRRLVVIWLLNDQWQERIKKLRLYTR